MCVIYAQCELQYACHHVIYTEMTSQFCSIGKKLGASCGHVMTKMRPRERSPTWCPACLGEFAARQAAYDRGVSVGEFNEMKKALEGGEKAPDR